MENDVGVAMADKAARMLNAHAAQDQRTAYFKPVGVMANADANHSGSIPFADDCNRGHTGRATRPQSTLRECKRLARTSEIAAVVAANKPAFGKPVMVPSRIVTSEPVM